MYMTTSFKCNDHCGQLVHTMSTYAYLCHYLLILPYAIWQKIEVTFATTMHTSYVRTSNRPMLQKIWSFTTHILSRLLIMFRRFNLTVPACLQLYQYTLRSQIEGYTRLLIFRKFSILPALIWASPFIQENFQPFCFFTYTNEIFPSSLLLLEPTCLLNLDKSKSFARL